MIAEIACAARPHGGEMTRFVEVQMQRSMILGIEIGGTKLQLGVSSAGGREFREFRRLEVRPDQGAAGIREQIACVGQELIGRHSVQRIGVGFGGPVDPATGKTITSHQIAGWERFPLTEWCEETLRVPTVLGNDCDAATLAEAKYGAGRGKATVFFLTVGTGVGGGCVVEGQLLGRGRPAIAEIGHLRPGLDATGRHTTVESIASGWGIVGTVRRLMANRDPADQRAVDELLARCGGDLPQLSAVEVTELARRGNDVAARAFDSACRALGWAIAQTITLLAPEVVVIGGGVSLAGEEMFFQPIREYAAQYVFPPLRDSYQIVAAELGERVVVHGAVALAEAAWDQRAGSPDATAR